MNIFGWLPDNHRENIFPFYPEFTAIQQPANVVWLNIFIQLHISNQEIMLWENLKMTLYIYSFIYKFLFIYIKKKWGGGVTPIFHISSSLVKIRFHTENQLPMLYRSALKVKLGGV